MRLKPLLSQPLYRHKAFSESVSVHSYTGSAGAAAIQGGKKREREKNQFIRHNSLNALHPSGALHFLS